MQLSDRTWFDERTLFLKRRDWTRFPTLGWRTDEIPLTDVNGVELRRDAGRIATDMLGVFCFWLIGTKLVFFDLMAHEERWHLGAALLLFAGYCAWTLLRAPFVNWQVTVRTERSVTTVTAPNGSATFAEATAHKDALMIAITRAHSGGGGAFQ